MKIALVIFPLQPSHGSILQTFALYNFLKKEGHIITILERKPPLLKPKELLKRFAKLVIRRCITSYKGPIFYRGRFPSIKMKELTPFINNYLGTDLTTTYSKTETCNFAESNHFDAYIVGSDQTWRPKYVTDIFHYYLDFLPDSYKQKRIAYAPSFGTDQWEYNAEQTKICKSLLSKFTAVSTREKSGTFLCRKYFGIDAVHVLDPTFLLNKSDYLSLVNNPQNTEQYHKSLCCYFLDKTEEKNKLAEIVSKELDLKPIYINNETENPNAPKNKLMAPSIEKWISGFAYGDFIITDSFHATIFAIMFNKPFITFGNIQRGLSRFTSLLKDLQLEDRLICSMANNNLKQILFHKIDWDKTNQLIEQLRTQSTNFLKTSLNK